MQFDAIRNKYKRGAIYALFVARSWFIVATDLTQKYCSTCCYFKNREKKKNNCSYIKKSPLLMKGLLSVLSGIRLTDCDKLRKKANYNEEKERAK